MEFVRGRIRPRVMGVVTPVLNIFAVLAIAMVGVVFAVAVWWFASQESFTTSFITKELKPGFSNCSGLSRPTVQKQFNITRTLWSQNTTTTICSWEYEGFFDTACEDVVKKANSNASILLTYTSVSGLCENQQISVDAVQQGSLPLDIYPLYNKLTCWTTTKFQRGWKCESIEPLYTAGAIVSGRACMAFGNLTSCIPANEMLTLTSSVLGANHQTISCRDVRDSTPAFICFQQQRTSAISSLSQSLSLTGFAFSAIVTLMAVLLPFADPTFTNDANRRNSLVTGQVGTGLPRAPKQNKT